MSDGQGIKQFFIKILTHSSGLLRFPESEIHNALVISNLRWFGAWHRNEAKQLLATSFQTWKRSSDMFFKN